MRIFVTGSTGFLGNNLIRMLVEDGHEVVAAVRFSSDLSPLDGLPIETLPLDLQDPAAVAMALQGIDVVIHAAAMIHLGWTRLAESRLANVETTRNLAVAARRKNIRMVLVSTVDTLAAATEHTVVDEKQTDPVKLECAYILSKREAEQVLLKEVESGLDGLIVNPGFLIGPWDTKPSSGKMMIMLWKQPILLYAPGGGCSAVDVRDVTDGIINAIKLGKRGERYILAGQNLTYLELWKMMAKVMGKRPPRVRMSSALATVLGWVCDAVSRIVRREGELNSASIKLGQMYNWYSSDKARREIGYRVTDVEVALHDAWDWFKQNKLVK
jgi:dihydroflavonol-4-reductase